MMDYTLFFLFAVFMVGTPGPANMLLMTSGGNFGLWRSLPFVAGVTFGKLFVNLGLGLGLWQLLSAKPMVLLALKIACVAYLAWLALRMSGFMMKGRELKRPETFWSGLLVHPLNPKAWAMLVFAYAHFSDPSQPWVMQVIIISATFFVVQVIFHTLWCAGGALVVAAVGGRPAERWLMRGLSVLTVLVVIWAVALDGLI
jgi:threonine/homoserine/homoserine lactone efflux protein